MHLGNGAITPECALWTLAAGGAGLAAVAWADRQPWTLERLGKAVAWGTLVFGAQAINVPLAWGSSAHLVGGVLLAVVLGPALGAWTMAAVLALQAFWLGDGGVWALGANVLNMGLLPAALVACARPRLDTRSAATQRAGWSLIGGVAVVLAATLIVVETAAFRAASELTAWPQFATTMIALHLLVGFVEALGTFFLLSAVAARAERLPVRLKWAPVLGVGLLLVVAGLWMGATSELPDGYEKAADVSGLARLLSE
jgi:cobalt/nickel transport system permease protein